MHSDTAQFYSALRRLT